MSSWILQKEEEEGREKVEKKDMEADGNERKMRKHHEKRFSGF